MEWARPAVLKASRGRVGDLRRRAALATLSSDTREGRLHAVDGQAQRVNRLASSLGGSWCRSLGSSFGRLGRAHALRNGLSHLE